MGIHITVEDALRALREAVDQRGEGYVYVPEADGGDSGGTCRNWHEEADEPGCIVGLSVYSLGVPAEVMRECATGGVDTLRHDLMRHGITMTDAAANAFKFAQLAQDGRATWGMAVAMADLTLDIYGAIDE